MRVWILRVAALAAMCLAVAGYDSAEHHLLVLGAWMMSWILALMALPCGGRALEVPLPSGEPFDRRELLLLILALLAASIIRLLWLTDFPRQLHNDEMSCGIEARRFLSAQGAGLFATGWFDYSNIGFFITSVFLRVFDGGLYGLRVSSVFFALLSLLAGYFLVRMLAGEKTAMWLIWLTAFFHFHLHFSRTGFHYMQGAGLIMLTLALFVYALRSRHPFVFGLCGVSLGIALQSYCAANILLLVLPLWALWLWRNNEIKMKTLWIAAGISLFTTLVTLAPHLAKSYSHPESFQSRSFSVLAFGQHNAAHVGGLVGSNHPLDIALYQLPRALGFFWQQGDTAVQYGFDGSLFDPLMLIFGVLGAVLSLTQSRRRGFVPIWIFTVLTVIFGAFITIDPPFSPRLTPLSPLICVFAALGLTWTGSKLAAFRHARASSVILAVFVLGVSASWNVNKYFASDSFYARGERRDQITRLLRLNPGIRSVINLFADEETFSHEAYTFMSPGITGINVKPEQNLKAVLMESKAPALLIAPPSRQLPELPSGAVALESQLNRSRRHESLNFSAWLIPSSDGGI